MLILGGFKFLVSEVRLYGVAHGSSGVRLPKTKQFKTRMMRGRAYFNDIVDSDQDVVDKELSPYGSLPRNAGVRLTPESRHPPQLQRCITVLHTVVRYGMLNCHRVLK